MGFTLFFFPDRAQIPTRCETVMHPKFVFETRAYPLNANNTYVFKKRYFDVSAENIGREKAVKIPCFLLGPLCLTISQNHYWKTLYSANTRYSKNKRL